MLLFWWLLLMTLSCVCGSALWIDGKHRQNIKSAYFLFLIESELLCSSLEVIFCNNKELQNNSWWNMLESQSMYSLVLELSVFISRFGFHWTADLWTEYDSLILFQLCSLGLLESKLQNVLKRARNINKDYFKLWVMQSYSSRTRE